jgi:hypothetical protein
MFLLVFVTCRNNNKMAPEVLLINSQLGVQKRHLECIPHKQVYPSVRNNINACCHGNCVDMSVHIIHMYIKQMVIIV